MLGCPGAGRSGVSVRQLPAGTVEARHDSCAPTAPSSVFSSAFGERRGDELRASGENPTLPRLLSKKSDFVMVLKCFSGCQREVFHFCGNLKLEYTELVS